MRHLDEADSAGTIPAAVIADHLVALTPHGAYASVAGADHFSFLPECKEGVVELLKSVGEIDPICKDAGDRSRANIHFELISLVRNTLQRDLKDQR